MFETLEARRLLSASAAFLDGSKVSASSGHMTFTGASSKDNNVVITELNTPGQMLVQNLATGEEAVFNGITDVNVALGSGNDTFFYNGATAPAHISGGEGSDAITILDRGNVSSDVDGGGGNDEIAVVFSHNASINGGGGDDLISINTAAGAGATIYDFSSSDIMVNGGGGDDTVVLYAGDVDYKGAGGNDTLIDLSGGTSSYSLKQVEVVETL